MEDGAGLDLKQFRLWYSQAGTPKVTARLGHDGETAWLHLTQDVPATPGQPVKQPMPIPLRIALFDPQSGTHAGEKLIVLDRVEARFDFPGHAARPVLSVNRGYSAPVAIDAGQGAEDLVFLAAHDDDPFARYEAMQSLVVQHLVGVLEGKAANDGREAIGAALAAVLDDAALDDLMRGELLVLPGEAYLAEQMAKADPVAIWRAREDLKAWLGSTLQDRFMAMHDRASAVPFALDARAKGARKVKTQVLVYLAAGAPDEAARRAADQYDRADNMTDRQGALMALCALGTPLRQERLDHFHARYAGNALVIDKWFSLQAGSLHPDALAHADALAGHADFNLHNPNRVRALYMALAANGHAFHDVSGKGYRMIADLILALDPLNAQTAARFVAPLGRWRRIEEGRAAMMRAELERIAKAPALSRDTLEQVSKSLG